MKIMSRFLVVMLLCMGSYHLQAQTHLYVDSAKASSGTGGSWAQAYKTLGEALNTANAGTGAYVISVAKGTYYPAGSSSATNRDSAYVLSRGGIKVIGGYQSGGSSRNVNSFPTILDGNINASGLATDNSYHLLIISNISAVSDSILIDGVTFQNAYANGTGTKMFNTLPFERDLGAAIYLRNVLNTGKTGVRNCTFTTNKALNGGGAILVNVSSKFFIDDCVFTQNAVVNTAAAYGGGALMVHDLSIATTARTVFQANGSATNGGAFYVASAEFYLHSCLITENFAAQSGGALYIDFNSYFEIMNATIQANSATNGDGGGMYSEAFGYIDNTIFYQNTMYHSGTSPNYTEEGSDVANNYSGYHIVRYSSMQHDPAVPAMVYSGYTDVTNSFVTNVDPQFLNVANKKGADNLWRTADDGLSLQATSLMINAGGNSLVAGVGTVGDITGANRTQLGTVDIGAYESATSLACPVGNTIYVDSSVAASGSGTSWATAFKSIQEAMVIINRCGNVSNILVAKGTYRPTPDNNKDSAIAILRGSVKIYGGYPKGGGTRDINNNPAIIDGNLGSGNNSYHLFILSNIAAGADSIVLDGLTMRNAKANGGSSAKMYNGEAFERHFGGAIYMRKVSNGTKTALRNCTFTDNMATEGGGAIITNIASSPLIQSCTFTRNTTTNNSTIYGGGAVFNANFSSPVISTCTFTANKAASNGGAVHQNDSLLTLLNCNFTHDTAGVGGAVFLRDNAGSYCVNNVFLNNVATGGPGGGIAATSWGKDTIINNVFVGNKCIAAATNGGGVAITGSGLGYLFNNTFYADSTTGAGGALYLSSGAHGLFNNIFYQCYSTTGTGHDVSSAGSYTSSGNSFNTTNPSFNNQANLPGPDHIWRTTDDGLRLKNVSPILNTGDNSKVPANTTTDITGASRIQGSKIEPGAYEGYSCSGNRVAYVDSSVNTSGDGTSWNTAYKTLAEATDAIIYCNSIDSILIAKGTYYPTGTQNGTDRNSSFNIPRNVKLYGGYANGGRGLRDINVYTTNLDGNINNANDSADNSYHILTITNQSAATDSIVLDGLTIKNGASGTDGGGAYLFNNMNGQKIAFRNVRFINNATTGKGGGIYAQSTSAAYLNCTFTGNRAVGAAGEGGGAFYNKASTSVFNNCSFHANTTATNGGALYNSLGAIDTIVNTVFTNNTAAGSGGSIHHDIGILALAKCRFTANRAGTGGAIYLQGTTFLTANSNVFNENYSLADGGVLKMDNAGSNVIVNNLFIHNKSGGDGSSIYITLPNKAFVNNTFYADSAFGGQHATAYTTSNDTLANNIFYKTYGDAYGTFVGNNSYSTTDPIFVDQANPAGADSTFGTADDGLRVTSISTTKDAGSNAFVPANVTVDMTGKPRIQNGTVDMGAYEGAIYPLHKLYVEFTKSGDGSDWANALRYLSDAISLANQYNNIDTILVSKGSYYPTGSVLGSARDSAFVLKRGGIKILGGYPSGGGTRDPATNVTSFDGDIIGAPNNTLHVLVIAGIGAMEDSILIDGFTIKNGFAAQISGADNIYNGQILYNQNGGGISFINVANGQKSMIANCTILGNYANTNGGGVYLSQSSPAFVNCILNRDSVNSAGGAVYCTSSNPVFRGCTFSNCNGAGGGGAMYNISSSPRIISSTIINNKASRGGGISNAFAAFPVIDSCIFSNNVASLFGGAMYSQNQFTGGQSPAPTVTNSSFTGNVATAQSGGAVYNSAPLESPVVPVFKNCTFTANTALLSGGAMYNIASSVPVLQDNSYTDNRAFNGGAIYNGSVVNPSMQRCSFINNKARGSGGAIHNSITNISITNSSFSGNKADSVGGAIYQLTNRLGIANTSFEGDTAQRGGAIFSYNGTTAVLNGNTFSKNISTTGGGGAVYLDYNSMFVYDTLVNNVFYRNKDIGANNSNGGAIYINSGTTRIFNNTFYGDTANTAGGAIYATFIGGNTATISLYNNILFKNAGGLLPDTAGIGKITQANNSFSITDPLFANTSDAKGVDNSWGTADDGLILTTVSTALNSGDNTKTPSIFTTDIKGAARIQTTTIDKGAYEGAFDACAAYRRLYVNAAAAPNGLGGSWGNAINNMSNALAIANSCANVKEIWVAAGTYKPSDYPTGIGASTGNKFWSFNLANGVKMYGGFNGTESALSQRNYINNQTILSGNIGDTTLANDNCFHVLCSVNDDTTSLLDGFIIADGYARELNSSSVEGGYLPSNAGGGIAMSGSSLRVANCIFRNNTAQFASRNNEGNAIYTAGAVNKLTNCIFYNNTSSIPTGTVHVSGGSMSLSNCVFHSNTAGISGTGSFESNNCSFTNSTSFTTYFSGTQQFRNSIIWNNTGSLFTNQQPGMITNCIIQGGAYTTNGNSSKDPRFTNIADGAGADGKWFTTDDGLQLQSCSPAINQGSNAASTTSLDLALQPRIFNTTIDMGAYEYQDTADAASLAFNNDTVSQTMYPGTNGLTTTDCRMLAQITPQGANAVAGLVTATTKLDASVQQYNNINYVQRHYDINPAANAATATARVTLFFTQAEFDNYNLVNSVKLPANAADAAGKNNLHIWQCHGTSTTGTPGSYSGTDTTINPDDGAIVWNSTNSRWEVSFNVNGFSGFFVIGISPNPLPLQLLSFTVKALDSKTALSWKVDHEAGIAFYKIQRSSNGSTFETIGEVAALQSAEYHFIDERPLRGPNYYRLSIEERDGSYHYSKVVRISFDEMAAASCVVYPNPANSVLHISLTGQDDEIVHLQYTDVTGRIARKADAILKQGEVIHDDISELANGNYLLSIVGKPVKPVRITVMK